MKTTHECRLTITEEEFSTHAEREIEFFSTNQNAQEFEKYMGIAFGSNTERLAMLRRILKNAKDYYEENFIASHGY